MLIALFKDVDVSGQSSLPEKDDQRFRVIRPLNNRTGLTYPQVGPKTDVSDLETNDIWIDHKQYECNLSLSFAVGAQ